jgi:hypothetical protein
LGFLCVSLVYVHAQLRGESILPSFWAPRCAQI